MDIANHPIYRQNLRYRFSLASADFIGRYYPPLRFCVGSLLEQAETISPHDPFVALRRYEWLVGRGQSDRALAVVEESLARQPDFVPLLEKAARYWVKKGRFDRAAPYAEKMLELYPAVRHWGYYHRLVVWERNQRQPD